MPGRKTVVELQYRESLFRAGLVAALGSQDDLALVVSDDAPPQTFKAGSKPLEMPDVLVADYESGIAVLRQARKQESAPRVLLVTDRQTEAEIRHALNSDVHGYLLADCDADELLDAVRRVARGMRPMSEVAIHRFTESLLHPALTREEQDVLRLLAKGLPKGSIAKQLGLALCGVTCATQRIMAKLSASSRAEAVATAMRRGLLRLVEATGTTDSCHDPDAAARGQGQSGSDI